jgi:LysR family transcriptional activator of dmlA
VNKQHPDCADLRVFLAVARHASFVAAADELGASTAFVTKRVKVVEALLETRLFNRTTRRVVVTEDGERALYWAQRILDDADHLLHDIGTRRNVPRGVLRVCSSLGFGRNVVGPALSGLAAQYPMLQVRFELFDRLIDIGAEGFDLDVRVGDEIAPNHIARRLAANHRVLCAAPAYLQRHGGAPQALGDLARHQCIVIKERDHPFGHWTLRAGEAEETVRVRASMSTNHGEIAVAWALDGRGIVLRSIWDVRRFIAEGTLVHVLPEWRQEANVWAVYPERLESSAKVRVCVQWLEQVLPALTAAAPAVPTAPRLRRAAASAR